MENIFIVTKITNSSMTEFIVDWIYGNDTKSVGGVSCVNLSSLPLQDRRSVSVVQEFLKIKLGSTFFDEQDAIISNTGSNMPRASNQDIIESAAA
jgi:hypothetical protein